MSHLRIFGPPGTGKTTFLLNKVEEYIAAGTPIDRIGFLAFTKKAAMEAKQRAVEKFNLPYRDFPYFRTLHSLAFEQLGLSRNNVMGPQNWEELGNLLGMTLKGFINPEDGIVANQQGDDRYIFLENLARNKCISLEEEWANVYQDDISWAVLERFQKGLEMYKKSRYLIDFSDMIKKFNERNKAPELDLLVIDEAQDLTEMQWRMVDVLMQNAKNIMIAGDDDQAIYRWAGASLDRFQVFDKSWEKIVLNQSYRIPSKVHELALSVSRRMERRVEKAFAPKKEEGEIIYHSNIEHVDMSQGDWLVLARNKYLLQSCAEMCDAEGYYYGGAGHKVIHPELITAIKTWEHYRQNPVDLTDEQTDLLQNYMKKKDMKEKCGLIWHEVFTKVSPDVRARVVAMLRRGEKITKEPRIKLSTIHGAKGGEAQNVVLYTDVSYKAFQEMQNNPDDELRVFYVAITRAKERLHIIEPQTNLYFRV